MSGVDCSRLELSEVVRSRPTSSGVVLCRLEPFGVDWSFPESTDVSQSCPKSTGVVGSRLESSGAGIVQSRPKSPGVTGVVQSRPESSGVGVGPSHPESSRVIRSRFNSFRFFSLRVNFVYNSDYGRMQVTPDDSGKFQMAPDDPKRLRIFAN